MFRTWKMAGKRTIRYNAETEDGLHGTDLGAQLGKSQTAFQRGARVNSLKYL